MKRLGLILSLLAVTACSDQNASEIINTDAQTMGVVGGAEVSSSDFVAKSTVFILAYSRETGDFKICTASLIQRNVLITAAHCYLDKNGLPLNSSYRFFVKFALSLDPEIPLKETDVKLVSASQFRTHPKFRMHENGVVANDIALVKLPDDAPSRYTATPILKSLSSLRKSTPVRIGGFGIHTWDGDEESNFRFKLRSMNSFIMNVNLGPSLQIPIKTWETLSAAPGDSGGPAFVKIGDQTYLWGVASTATDGGKGWATYEPIPRHLPWLRTAAKDLKVSVDF